MSVKVKPRLPALLSGLAGADPETALTPWRQSYLLFDFPEPQIQRLPYTLYREGHDLQPSRAFDLGVSYYVEMLPSGWWCCRPYQMEYLFEQSQLQQGIIRLGGAGAVNVGNFVVLPSYQEHPMWRKPTELTGLTFGPDTATQGDHFIIKGVTALGDWSASMPFGPGADTPPPLGGSVQMVRGAVGDTPHEENTGYSVRFQVPAHVASSPDAVAHMTFGGPTPTTARDGSDYAAADLGGTHAVTFWGNGRTTLWEYVKQTWREVFDGAVHEFKDGMRNLVHWIIMPQKHGPMNMFAAGTNKGHINNPAVTTTPHPRPIPLDRAVYHPHPNVTGYAKKDNATGQGPVKFDHRADLRIYFQVSRLIYPPGRLVDQPFFVTPKLGTDPAHPELDILILTVVKDEPAGTSITATVRDPGFAFPGNALTPASAPDLKPGETAWQTRPGQQAYYVTFDFTPSADGLRTPFLKGYHVLCNGVRIDFPPDRSWSGTTPRSYSITSADIDPTHETCRFECADVDNSLEALRIRTRVPVQVRTQYDPEDGSKFSVLFQGETALVNATKRGRERGGVLWPSPSWRNLEVGGVGMASRVSDQLAVLSYPFATFDVDNPAANPPQPTKLTRCIDLLLNGLGYPDDMRDIPDLPTRCFPNPNDDSAEFMLQPTANVLEFINHICRQHLGYYLVFDANAGGPGTDETTARGMWRVLAPPEAPYTPLWTFTTAPPPRAGPQLAYKLPAPPGAPGPYSAGYDDRTTFIRRLRTWVEKPEGNYLIVTTGTGKPLPNNNGTTIGTVVMWNPNSVNLPGMTTADPDGPDYLGRIVPLVWYETQLQNITTQFGNAGLVTVAKRVFQQACVAQKWIEFDAPLVLVTPAMTGDPLQKRPRPLRLYDPIRVEDVQQGVMLSCVVRSVTYNWKSDRAQMMTVQALAPADANSGIVRSI